MAIGLSVAEANRIVDYVTASVLTIRPHTGDPGSSGTSSRIAISSPPTLAVASWGVASNGDKSYNAEIGFGALSTTATITTTHYSLYRAGVFVGSGIIGSGSGQTVVANAAFSVNSGTLDFNYTGALAT